MRQKSAKNRKMEMIEENFRKKRMNAWERLALLLCVGAVCLGCCVYLEIPESVSVRNDGTAGVSLSLPFVSVRADAVDTAVGENETVCTYTADACIFGVPVKDVSVNVYDENLRLCPGGMTFGVRLTTKGVMIIGICDVITSKGSVNPAQKAGIEVSDVIIAIDGKECNTVSDVTETVAQSEGKEMLFTLERDGKSIEKTVTPALSEDDGAYRAGLWVRDGTAGIGTVTYVNAEDMSFGGLGHGVCDADTGEVMPLKDGTVFDVTVSGIVKGAQGKPGELKGYFNSGKCGMLTSNTETGVYGVFAALPGDCREPMPIALKDEIMSGDAKILCSLDDGKVNEYSVTVEKLQHPSGEKNMIVRINDQSLVEKTGGIVQGMSGSPIIQDGKLIGAVTHVMINDPLCGYGIYIENMLSNAN